MWWFVAVGYAAQGFLDPLPAPLGSHVTVTLRDGTTLEGEPNLSVKGEGAIDKVTVKLADETKVKVELETISELVLIPNGLARMAAAANAAESITELSHTEHQEASRRDEALFVGGTLPNGKPALLQVLNPDFMSTMRVLADPAARETTGVSVGGLAVSGGVNKSYLVQKAGETATILVRKGDYDELWDTLYGGCAAMQRPEKPDFQLMADDVRAHVAACGPAVE